MSIDHRSYSSGTRNTRRGRHSRPNQVYHVTMVTRRRARLFTDLSRGRVVVDAIRKESESGRCATLCFVVMPDHVHWLVRITEQGDLSKVVRRVKADVSSEAERLGRALRTYGRTAFTIMRCEATRISWLRRGISWLIRSAPGWCGGSVTIRCGMRCGSDLKGFPIRAHCVRSNSARMSWLAGRWSARSARISLTAGSRPRTS